MNPNLLASSPYPHAVARAYKILAKNQLPEPQDIDVFLVHYLFHMSYMYETKLKVLNTCFQFHDEQDAYIKLLVACADYSIRFHCTQNRIYVRVVPRDSGLPFLFLRELMPFPEFSTEKDRLTTIHCCDASKSLYLSGAERGLYLVYGGRQTAYGIEMSPLLVGGNDKKKSRGRQKKQSKQNQKTTMMKTPPIS